MFTDVDVQDDSVPIRLSATIILIKQSEKGLQALLMHRNSKLNFCGGFWVFPGGAVEDQDAADDIATTLKNAAVRETFEEAGVALACDDLIPFARWVTPQGASKRFDTWFYLAGVDDINVSIDGSEIVDSVWTSPADAIERHHAQDVELLPPTMISLMGLAQFTQVADALAYYRQKTLFEYLPKVSFLDDQLVMLYPGDAAYESKHAADESAQHRCLHKPDGWHYVNEISLGI